MVVPVVDKDEDKHKWNRHLRCVNCVLGPTIAVLGASHSGMAGSVVVVEIQLPDNYLLHSKSP